MLSCLTISTSTALRETWPAPGIRCSHIASELIDEFADSGIFFLDEIGELGLDEQAMLLRAIEEKRLLPWVGPRSPQRFSSDLGSNRDPQTAARSGRFSRRSARAKHFILQLLPAWAVVLPLSP
jgi:sigma54-dependent transcription regulator